MGLIKWRGGAGGGVDCLDKCDQNDRPKLRLSNGRGIGTIPNRVLSRKRCSSILFLKPLRQDISKSSPRASVAVVSNAVKANLVWENVLLNSNAVAWLHTCAKKCLARSLLIGFAETSARSVLSGPASMEACVVSKPVDTTSFNPTDHFPHKLTIWSATCVRFFVRVDYPRFVSANREN